jgi:hypothetical protein
MRERCPLGHPAYEHCKGNGSGVVPGEAKPHNKPFETDLRKRRLHLLGRSMAFRPQAVER